MMNNYPPTLHGFISCGLLCQSCRKLVNEASHIRYVYVYVLTDNNSSDIIHDDASNCQSVECCHCRATKDGKGNEAVEESSHHLVEESNHKKQRQKRIKNENYLLKIPNFPKVFTESKLSKSVSFVSDPFYTEDGYHMKYILRPNGTGGSWGTHMSVYYALVRGDHDHSVKWPFDKLVSFAMFHGNENAGIFNKMKIPPDKDKPGNMKPVDENIEIGIEKFLCVEEIEQFLAGDLLTIKMSIRDPR